jgi:hypothetical protein
MAAATSSSLVLRGFVGVPSWWPVLLMLLDKDSLALCQISERNREEMPT